ncbi:MAG: hypothetical protein IH582_12360, partial [Afipia sp.]|nr:hypothetical protein [Afipia sp.]
MRKITTPLLLAFIVAAGVSTASPLYAEEGAMQNEHCDMMQGEHGGMMQG